MACRNLRFPRKGGAIIVRPLLFQTADLTEGQKSGEFDEIDGRGRLMVTGKVHGLDGLKLTIFDLEGPDYCESCLKVVRLAGFEPATFGSGDRRSSPAELQAHSP